MTFKNDDTKDFMNVNLNNFLSVKEVWKNVMFRFRLAAL